MATYSRVTYTGTGSAFNASFSFPYLNQSDIYVYVNGVSVPFTFLNTSTVTPTAIPAAGAVVQVRRSTQKATAPVNFTDGSVILEKDLDLLATYSLYLGQEADDAVTASITLNTSNLFDAQGIRVINLANPVDLTDAVNRQYFESVYTPLLDAKVTSVAASATTATTQAGIAAVQAAASAASAALSIANSANVTTVAGIASNVTTVAGISANVTAVANNATNVNAAVANAANINSAVSNATNINAAVTNATNITTVAGIASNVTTVAGISTDVTAVKNNAANVTTVAGNTNNINAVAANTANINSAVTNATNINAAVANATNISTVAGINASVTAVAGNASNIAAVVGNAANINDVAANAVNINAATTSAATAVTQAAAALSSATAASGSASSAAASSVDAASFAASAATLLDNFDDRYLGAKAADPATDNDGATLLLGTLYFNTADSKMRLYTSSGWINTSSSSVAALTTFKFIATAGQTTFIGADSVGSSLTYITNGILVSLNGSILVPVVDYASTDGLNIVLSSAAVVGDELNAYCFASFAIADTHTRAEVVSLLAGKLGVSANAVSATLASTVTTNANLTGDVTSVGNASTLANTTVAAGSYTQASITVDAKGRVTAASSGTVSSAPALVTTSFSVVESGGKLYFKYGATNIASMDSTGNFTALNNVSAYTAP